MSDNDLRLQAWKVAVIENIAIYAAIAICTIAVAYFAKSASGLWSMILLICVNSPTAGEDEQ